MVEHQNGLSREEVTAPAWENPRSIWTMLSYTWCDSWDCPVQGQELASMIFVGPVQLRIFYYSMKSTTQLFLEWSHCVCVGEIQDLWTHPLTLRCLQSSCLHFLKKSALIFRCRDWRWGQINLLEHKWIKIGKSYKLVARTVNWKTALVCLLLFLRCGT